MSRLRRGLLPAAAEGVEQLHQGLQVAVAHLGKGVVGAEHGAFGVEQGEHVDGAGVQLGLAEFIGAVGGLGGLLLTEGLMWLAVDLAGLSAPLAKLPVTGLVMVWNFGLRRLLVFFR